MNYLTESRRNALAAEYVLGTLRGKARQRWQHLMMNHQLLAETTWAWEQHLNEMATLLPTYAPPPQVWERIQQRLEFNTSAKTSTSLPREASSRKTPIRAANSSVWWKTFSGVAASAAIVLGVLVATSPSPSPIAIQQVAVVNDSESTPLWIIELSEEKLTIRTTRQLSARADSDFELWMIPENGTAPISLGLLPATGNSEKIAPKRLFQPGIKALAVSLEPIGGSNGGAPTKVLYIAPLVKV